MLLVSFKRQYPQWLFPGRSDKDPSKKPLKVEDARHWIDSLNPFTWLATLWRIRHYRPDALILQWWTTFWAPAWFVLGMLNRLFLHRPLIYICHNVLPHEVRWWDPLVAKIALHWGTRFIVQSAEQERLLLSLLPGAQTAIAPLPIFDMFTGERITKEDARARSGLPPDVLVLLFFGIVREYKGLKDLLAALPEIRERLGKVTLVVAGEFWEDKRPYLEMIERLGIGDSVLIEDRYIPNEEVPLYFSAADLLVAPYRQVTGSAVVQIARGLGVPIVTTSVGGMSQVAADDATWMLVPPGDSEALAQAIAHFLTARPGFAGGVNPQAFRSDWDWQQLIGVIETAAQPFA